METNQQDKRAQQFTILNVFIQLISGVHAIMPDNSKTNIKKHANVYIHNQGII